MNHPLIHGILDAFLLIEPTPKLADDADHIEVFELASFERRRQMPFI
jgi:hypothetical protein